MPPLLFRGLRQPDHTHDDPDGMHLPNHDAAKDHGNRIVHELKDGGYCPGNAALHRKSENSKLVPGRCATHLLT